MITTQFGEYLSVYHFIVLAIVLFGIGLFGMLRRKNILLLFLSSEIMLNAINIALVATGAMFHDLNGQIFALFVIAIAASEVAVGLGLVLLWYRKHKSLDIDHISVMRG
ncbi:NADH-quinone oxidoreductase subunit K [Helicobacter sp. CLO-3]|uniref:NADH-quinone oxidoreductase subunit NuoK n=1 Tax=unclassified Helicobacter TaxID=2593540 RepID=UPI00080581B5|nr:MULTISPECIES: NADH-quinone oxidoreductase subunit NuoK [unclassified Helicobacter]OBV29664.1 NADH-quinone oxidoreductase subunit K [Helicobacter sp. CLO-3]OHU82418.1 NADH-quinone oxidoreductase subunit K [Helicobacter sp. CLO-3]